MVSALPSSNMQQVVLERMVSALERVVGSDRKPACIAELIDRTLMEYGNVCKENGERPIQAPLLREWMEAATYRTDGRPQPEIQADEVKRFEALLKAEKLGTALAIEQRDKHQRMLFEHNAMWARVMYWSLGCTIAAIDVGIFVAAWALGCLVDAVPLALTVTPLGAIGGGSLVSHYHDKMNVRAGAREIVA
jgi:hypothetical protein